MNEMTQNLHKPFLLKKVYGNQRKKVIRMTKKESHAAPQRGA